MKADIAIIGGGIIGTSIAWHLRQADQGADIVVVERDPTYELAATPRGNGGIRQLFSIPENIRMAQHGLTFYAGLDDVLAQEGQDTRVGFRRQGYLFISDTGQSGQMIANHAVQERHGVNAELLEPSALKDRFPSLNVNDIAVAVHSPDDAWIDPYSALMGLRRSAISDGVHYCSGEVVAWTADNARASTLTLADGTTIAAEATVLACGAWSAEVASLIGLDLPVEPMSRESYFFRTNGNVEPLPFLKSESDVAIRPEGEGYVGGVPNWAETAGWNFDPSERWFEDVVWPALANRVPAFEEVKLERIWRGHYARNAFDYSPIIGPWRGASAKVIIATGFSGHGIMHAPATGRGVAELLTLGRFSSIDLNKFRFDRIADNRPVREAGIV
ncbi:MAG: NAD(P)/FAD-dependent oxidoreductase [Hyphomicrobiaceae bacterium]